MAGLDFANPQTAQTLVGGGLALFALIILWRVVGAALKAMKHEDNKTEESLVGLLSTVLTNINTALERSTDAIQNNNEAIVGLKQVFEAERVRTDTAINRLDTRVERLEGTLGEVNTKVTRIEGWVENN